jgi:hypothetical protein
MIIYEWRYDLDVALSPSFQSIRPGPFMNPLKVIPLAQVDGYEVRSRVEIVVRLHSNGI